MSDLISFLFILGLGVALGYYFSQEEALTTEVLKVCHVNTKVVRETYKSRDPEIHVQTLNSGVWITAHANLTETSAFQICTESK